MPRDPETLALLALSPEEYDQIVERLDREPNDVELGMFGAMWSEHCGYKNSKPLLRLFPSTGPQVLTTRGGENAGAVDIGGGYCAVFKIESHNHPSAVEPYQGAATGVGGIVRDIFAMGARPIAILDSLRFGPLREAKGADTPRAAHNRSLFRGVVAGIGGYGNCLGVPTVGGEVSFSDSYDGNPLVNALCVGIARSDKLLRAIAQGVGNPIILVGADTGRDGIGGANVLASRTFEAGSEELRPTVQVGNPFLEKLLMEACVELAEQHGDWIVGLQDLGAAGLTSSLVECAARGEAGVEIDVALVPRREQGMTAYEVMLSESQERMLVVAKKEHEADVLRHFQRWEIHADVIGHVTEGNMVRIRDGDELMVRVPAEVFTEPPEYRRQGIKPKGLDELQTYDLAFLPDIVAWEQGPSDANAALLQLLASPEIASKRWIYRQYDHQVLTNTVLGPGADAAVLRIKDAAPRAIALATDGNGVKTYLDPFAGGALAVAEACRNVACSGARPIAVTDCLNFGNPERLDVYFQLEEAVRGMAAACETLGVPVVSGNVSLFNESDGTAIYPTPVVGALGVMDDVSKTVPSGFRGEGDVVYLLGAEAERRDGDDVLAGEPVELAGSEYLRQFHGLVAGSVRIDLALEARVQHALVEAAEARLLLSAHDCSHGGLAVTLAEACIENGIGFSTEGLRLRGRRDAALFGETASRVVVSVREDANAELEALLQREGVPYLRLGRTSGDRLRIATNIDLPVSELQRSHGGGLETALMEAQPSLTSWGDLDIEERQRVVTSLGVWKPLTPKQVATVLADLDVPWWIAGGLAIDAFLGHKTREHGDIDVGVLRRDQLAVQDALEGWDLQATDPPGTLRPWRQGETLPETVHDIWCRPNPEAAWGLQLMLDEADGDTWEFRRNPAIARPLQSLIWRKAGVPYLVPEVQLLYKAQTQSPKNEADFRAALPKLNEYQRVWLAASLGVAHPGHPWIDRLKFANMEA